MKNWYKCGINQSVLVSRLKGFPTYHLSYAVCNTPPSLCVSLIKITGQMVLLVVNKNE